VISEQISTEIDVEAVRAMTHAGLVDESISGEDYRVLAEGYYRLAKVFYDKADLGRAHENFLKALELQSAGEEYFLQFKILGFLVRIASERMENELASKYICQSELLLQRMSYDLNTLTAEFHYNQGIVATYQGSFAEARESFLKAYSMAKEDNGPELLSKTIYALAMGYFQTRKFSKALEVLDELSELLNIIKKYYLIGSMNVLYGNIYNELGLHSKALEYFGLGNEALVDKNCWNLYGYILLGQGIAYKKMDKYSTALTYFEQGLSIIDQDNFRRLTRLYRNEINDVNDITVDIYMDYANRMIHEKSIGTVDFKHRFVLLEILFLLAKHSGEYFDKERLARVIWGDEYNPLIHDKLIYTSVSRLRKLIEPKGGKRKYIIRGKDGYTFNPEVNIRFHRDGQSLDVKAIGNVEIINPV
jgi:tetratricopeptide (TPR) repeat protein